MIAKEDEDGMSHNIDETTEEVSKNKEYPDRKVDGIEMCQDSPLNHVALRSAFTLLMLILVPLASTPRGLQNGSLHSRRPLQVLAR